MKKIIQSLVLITVFASALFSQASMNMTLISQKNEHNAGGTPAGWHYASCIGWTSPTNKEYAIIGYWNGTAIYDITNNTVVQCDTVPGPTSFYGYREFTIVGNYLYIVSEGNNSGQGGLQIVDLSPLPDSVRHVRNWTFSGYTTTHTIKSAGNYLYLNGSNYNNGGLVIIDVTDRENPVKLGNGPAEYVHDCFVRNDTVYAANIYANGKMTFINVTNKNAPTVISTFTYPNGFCHNIWTSNDRKWMLTTDEANNMHLRLWNSQNLSNITFVYEYIPYETAMVHNAYFKGDTVFMAHYRAGVVALNVSNLPSQPTVIGYYDTYPGSGTAYQGAWNVFPYYNSGKFIVSDIATGLYVFRFGVTGITQNGTEIPSDYSLGQNYPNPFNPTTKFNFEIPKSGDVSLKIYDVNGKVVETMFEGYRFAGKYIADFNASKLASGVYFYSLTADGFSETKKMVLTK
jgi:choice-of-anchor B domain-containing protein